MSAALGRLKQQSEQAGQQPLPDPSDSMMTTLTSILDVAEAQRVQLMTLTEGQKKLAAFVRVMDEQQALQLERLKEEVDRTLISSRSVSAPLLNESVESRLSEIESTLSEFLSALDGRQLRAAASTLITEASRNRTDMASATARAAEQVSAATRLVRQAQVSTTRIEKQAHAAIEQVAAASTEAVAGQVVEKIKAAEARADKVLARVDRIEARQLWSAAGAMCLTLLPAATVVVGGILIVAGLVYGWEIAVMTEAATWLRVVRGVGALLGTLCALVGLAAVVRWVAGHVSTWKVSPGSIRWRR